MVVKRMVEDPGVKDDPRTQADPEPKDDQTPDANDSDDTSSTNESESGDLAKWLYGVPKPLREDLKEFGSASEAWSALVDLKGRADRSIELPGEDATPEEVAAFNKRLGRPDGPEGYGLAKPADWPEGLPWNDNVLRVFSQNAFAAGLTKKQAQELFAQETKEASKMVQAKMEKDAAQQKKNRAMLLEMGGGTEEGVAQLLAESEQAFRTVGSPELLELFKSYGLDKHPLVIQSYQRAYNAVKDDDFFRARESDVNRQKDEEPWRKVYEQHTRK